MDKTYWIQREELTGDYELICKPGFGIDGQHYFIEDTFYAARKLAKEVAPCDCSDCINQLSQVTA